MLCCVTATGSQKLYSEKKTDSVGLRQIPSSSQAALAVPQLAISNNKSKIVKAPIIILD